MTGAATGPTDGIVQVELSIDDDPIGDIVACVRAGCASWVSLPFASAVDASGRQRRVDAVLAFSDELVTETARVAMARQAHYRDLAKREAKEARARARAAE